MGRKQAPGLLADVIAWLETERGHWPGIATASGVKYDTLAKIVQGRLKNPGIKTIEKLIKHMQQRQAA